MELRKRHGGCGYKFQHAEVLLINAAYSIFDSHRRRGRLVDTRLTRNIPSDTRVAFSHTIPDASDAATYPVQWFSQDVPGHSHRFTPMNADPAMMDLQRAFTLAQEQCRTMPKRTKASEVQGGLLLGSALGAQAVTGALPGATYDQLAARFNAFNQDLTNSWNALFDEPTVTPALRLVHSS